jgi:hypothetical protein
MIEQNKRTAHVLIIIIIIIIVIIMCRLYKILGAPGAFWTCKGIALPLLLPLLCGVRPRRLKFNPLEERKASVWRCLIGIPCTDCKLTVNWTNSVP